MRNKIIVSAEHREITGNLQKFGYEIIASEKVNCFLSFEQKHADMQCLKIKDTYFVLKNCKTLYENLENLGLNVVVTTSEAKGKYPYNVLLNCVYIKDKLYCKRDSVDETVLRFCEKENIEIINVNQGYTKCSTAIVDDKIITSDMGIFKAMTQNGVEGLLIKTGDIKLENVNYGFIGGCCFADADNVYFSGDITKHKDYKEIEKFCHNNKKNIVCLTNKELYDIGGFVVI